MFLGCLPPLLSRTPARRREARRGLWRGQNIYLITSTLTKVGTEVWGPKTCMPVIPLPPSFSGGLPVPLPCGNSQTQRGHGSCTSLHVAHPTAAARECKYGLYRDKVGALTPLRGLCHRVSAGLALGARLPCRRGAKGNTARHSALFRRASSAHAHRERTSLTKRFPCFTSCISAALSPVAPLLTYVSRQCLSVNNLHLVLEIQKQRQ